MSAVAVAFQSVLLVVIAVIAAQAYFYSFSVSNRVLLIMFS